MKLTFKFDFILLAVQYSSLNNVCIRFVKIIMVSDWAVVVLIRNIFFENHDFFYHLLQLFDHLKELRGADIINKVHAIPGDVSELNLAISDSDRQMLAETVHIVYHAAATIRFDEALKKAVLLNTRGTKLVLDLAKKMKNLQVPYPKLMEKKFFWGVGWVSNEEF